MPFTGQDSFEYFGTLYHESAPDLLSYYRGEPCPSYRQYDSYSDPVNDGASLPSFAIQQEFVLDYSLEIEYSNSSNHSSNESARDTESTTPSTTPSASCTLEDAEQSQAAIRAHDGLLPARANAFACPQCHKVFPKDSVLR